MYSAETDREQARFLKDWKDRRLKRKVEKYRRKLEQLFREYVGDDTIRIGLQIVYQDDGEETEE